MQTVTMSEQEWQAVMNILGTAPAPWVTTNPLLMKIGDQLRQQANQAANPIPKGGNLDVSNFDPERSATPTRDGSRAKYIRGNSEEC